MSSTSEVLDTFYVQKDDQMYIAIITKSLFPITKIRASEKQVKGKIGRPKKQPITSPYSASSQPQMVITSGRPPPSELLALAKAVRTRSVREFILAKAPTYQHSLREIMLNFLNGNTVESRGPYVKVYNAIYGKLNAAQKKIEKDKNLKFYGDRSSDGSVIYTIESNEPKNEPPKYSEVVYPPVTNH